MAIFFFKEMDNNEWQKLFFYQELLCYQSVHKKICELMSFKKEPMCFYQKPMSFQFTFS